MASQVQLAQEYSLAPLKNAYKAIQSKIKSFEPLEIILELNKTIGIDQILVREGYEQYQKLQELQKGDKKYQLFESFFNYMKKDMYLIENLYLKDANSKIQENSKQTNLAEAVISYNFLLNKNSISKFIRDQAAHYQQALEEYSENIINNEQEVGIHSNKIYLFVKKLFNSKYTKIIYNFTNIESKTDSELKELMESIIGEYGLQNKQMSLETTKKDGFYINEEEILDFLTFWLQADKNKNLFVLYARTQKRLLDQCQILTNIQGNAQQIIKHPSQLTMEEIVNKNAEIQDSKQKKANVQHIKDITAINIVENSHKKTQSNFNKHNLVEQKQKKIEEPKYQIKQIKVAPHRETKEEKFRKQLKNLFKFGCKKRYAVHKNQTFDDIQHESNFMTRQKFINFCLHFEVQELVPIEILKQYFKSHAINSRTLDFQRFNQILLIISENNPKIISNFLNKKKYDEKEKLKQIRRDEKFENVEASKLSKYKFILQPINGKDLESMKHELSDKKLLKLQLSSQKKSNERQFNSRKQIQHKSVIAKSHKSIPYNHTILEELSLLKNKKHNPQFFLTLDEDQDKIWDAYEAKIWKKESSYLGLENILNKRFQAGKKMLPKLNSTNQFHALQ